MSTIRPFAAIRYAQAEVSNLLAPPYDVLDQRGKDALLAKDARNFVRIDLPFVPPKSAGPAEVYAGANQTMQTWLNDGTLKRDTLPLIYVYHQRYTHAGVNYTRKMFFARLRLEPFGQGSVFPHERTFGGPKEDRLALMKATQVHLSPIFGLYEDAQNEVSALLEQGLGQPIARGTLEGVENTLWGVSDATTIERVQSLMNPKAIYIADGHHRYGTAMLYRDWLAQERGPLSPEHPANYVLCVFCAMEDPGALILPTHRVLNVRVAPEVLTQANELEIKPLSATDADEVVRELAAHGPQAVAWLDPVTGKYQAVRPRRPELLDALEPEHSPAWRRLGLAFLHAYLLDRVIKPQVCGGQDPKIEYIKSARDAATYAKDHSATAFLMQPTTMAELSGVCSAGDLMPQKSTYFYPKLASGLVVNPLTE